MLIFKNNCGKLIYFKTLTVNYIALEGVSMKDNKKVPIGISGLDKALNGGLPKRNLVLISGGAGTGKSTLSLQYLYNGAKKYHEKGLYISTEQTEEELRKQAAEYGWDLAELERKNLLHIKYYDITKTRDVLQKIYDSFVNLNPERMVIDSLTTLSDAMLVSGVGKDSAFSFVQVAESVTPVPRTEQIVAKTLLYQLVAKLKLFDSTVLMTSELPEGLKKLSADGVSEFIADGVIVLRYMGVGTAGFRSAQIRKMRYTDHQKGNLSYEIGREGLDFTEQNI